MVVRRGTYGNPWQTIQHYESSRSLQASSNDRSFVGSSLSGIDSTSLTGQAEQRILPLDIDRNASIPYASESRSRSLQKSPIHARSSNTKQRSPGRSTKASQRPRSSLSSASDTSQSSLDPAPTRPPRRRGHQTGDPDRPRCPVCSKTFSRLEHMDRHAAMHKQPAQNTCSVCGKTFHRIDALRRHMTIHTRAGGTAQSDLPRQPSTQKRQQASSPANVTSSSSGRTAKACGRCWRMKLRCDESRPCKRCERANLQDECFDSTARPEQNAAQSSVSSREQGETSQWWPDTQVPFSGSDGRVDWNAVHQQSMELVPAMGGESTQAFHPATESPAALSHDSVPHTGLHSSVSPAGQPPQMPVIDAVLDPPTNVAPSYIDKMDHMDHVDHVDHVDQATYTRSVHVGGASESGLVDTPISAAHSIPDGASSFAVHRSVSFAGNDGRREHDARHEHDTRHEQHDSPQAHRPTASVSATQRVEASAASLETHANMWPEIAPSHMMSAPSDVVDMTDLHWLFPAPLEPHSMARSHRFESLFTSLGIATHLEHHLASSVIAETTPAISSPGVQTASANDDNAGEDLLSLLAGAATRSPPFGAEHVTSSSQASGWASRPSGMIPDMPLTSSPRQQASRQRPGPSNRAEMHFSASATEENRRDRKKRRLEPQDLTAPSRRNSFSGKNNMSPSAQRRSAAVQQSAGAGPDASQNLTEGVLWPDSWYPGDREKQRPRLKGFSIALLNATPEMIAEQSTCQVPPLDEHSVSALQNLTDLVPDDDMRSSAILEAINKETYNMMLQLYFERFHPLYPFLSQANFRTSTVHPLLLGACCAVGCTYAPMPHAQALAEFLADQVHVAISTSCQDNNLHARSVSIIQSLLLVGILFGSSGNKCLLEHAEYSRSALATMVRRSHLLKHQPAPCSSPGESLDSQWRAWLSWEGIKRTGWACVLADIELSATWKLPPIYGLDELRAELPLSNRRYEAESAEAWAAFRPNARDPPTDTLAGAYARLQEGLEVWQRGHPAETQLEYPSPTSAKSSIDALRPITASLFHAKILAASLHLYAAALRGFSEQQLLKTDSNAALQHLHALIASACNAIVSTAARPLPSEGHPSNLRHQEAIHEADTATGQPAVAFELVARFVQLYLFVDLTDLQSLAGRKGSSQSTAALAHLKDRITERPTEAVDVAKACGRIVALVRGNSSVVVYDSAFLFFASLFLYAFTRVHASDNPASNKGEFVSVCLDAPSPVAFSSNPSQTAPVRYQLRFVGDLSASATPVRLLKTHAKLLIEDLGERSHRLAKILGTVLRDLSKQLERE